MVSKEERLDILDKLAHGKLSVSDAAALLSTEEKGPAADTIKVEEEISNGKTTAPAATPSKAHHSNGKKPRWMRIQVDDVNTGQRRVSVNLPLGLMKFGLKMGRRFAPELEAFDVDELTAVATDMESGLLVEVHDEQDGEHVRIFVE